MTLRNPRNQKTLGANVSQLRPANPLDHITQYALPSPSPEPDQDDDLQQHPQPSPELDQDDDLKAQELAPSEHSDYSIPSQFPEPE